MFTLSDFYNILNFLDNTTSSDLDVNTKTLAISEQSISTNLFENTIDQVPYITDDYKRLKKFLINWYTAHRTIITTQKQATDVFSLPDSHISELIQSFGFTFSIKSLSTLTKSNFFLDLINLYKVKGTTQTLIDILQYFGLSSVDVAEYWLQKNSSGNLIFKSEKYLPVGVVDVKFSDIDFDDMVSNDPHWRLSKSQVENLISNNKIALPSKSPYFSVRPRYDLSLLNMFISLLSRNVQDAYNDYISNGITVRDIKLSQLNEYVSFFELYLSCIYLFNSLYGSTTSLYSDFLCYDSTSENNITIINDIYDNLITRPISRDVSRINRNNFYDIFTRNISSNFIETNSPGYLLNIINNSLYNSINSYISTGSGEELVSYIINDLNDWLNINISSGYPNLVSTVFGIGSLLGINKIINFFKPYHSRMKKFDFALIVDSPLFDSINVEDDIIHSEIENVVDFDTADSTGCVVCSDSTCVSHYSREFFDCGARFDDGASVDNIFIYVDDGTNVHQISPVYG